MVKPKTAKKIKTISVIAGAKGYTRDNIEWIRTYLFGLPPTPQPGFTEEEYWEYLDFKYGDYNSQQYMEMRADLYKTVVGKPCPIIPIKRPSKMMNLS